MKPDRKTTTSFPQSIARHWTRFWMRYSGLGFMGRTATRLAAWAAPPHKARLNLARMTPKGYISAKAVLHHGDLRLGSYVFVDDRALIFQRIKGGRMTVGDRVCIYRDTILETGYGGTLSIGDNSSIHPRCQINAYISHVRIGSGVMIAPACAFYPYDHGFLPDRPIRRQPLRSKGDIIIGDEAWLGYGTIVLGGVRIGNGAAIGAGSVVTRDIPDDAIAVGNPARVVKMRTDLPRVERLGQGSMPPKTL